MYGCSLACLWLWTGLWKTQQGWIWAALKHGSHGKLFICLFMPCNKKIHKQNLPLPLLNVPIYVRRQFTQPPAQFVWIKLGLWTICKHLESSRGTNKCWCPWSCREGTEEPLDPAPCQGHRQNRISGSEEQMWEDLRRIWTLQEQSPEAVSCLASCLLLWLIHPPFFQRVPWVRRRFSLQICSQLRIRGSFSRVTSILQCPS